MEEPIVLADKKAGDPIHLVILKKIWPFILGLIAFLITGKLLLLSYLLTHGIYPYDFLLKSSALIEIYLICGALYCFAAFLFYGWLTLIIAKKNGKLLDFPKWPLVILSVLAHLSFVLSVYLIWHDYDLFSESKVSALDRVIMFGNAGDAVAAYQITIINLACWALISILAALLITGDLVRASRIRVVIALIVLAGAITGPHATSILVSYTLRNIGLGGGLAIHLEMKDDSKRDGFLVLLGPETIYFTNSSENNRVSLLERESVARLVIEQSHSYQFSSAQKWPPKPPMQR